MTAVSVTELQRAWAAVENGEFTEPGRRRPSVPIRPGPTWRPDTSVVLVAGAAGRVGATTVTLAAASGATTPVRVLECGPARSSGLAAATTAELGTTATGWRQGTRDHVLIERPIADHDCPDAVPLPEPTDCAVTLVDLSWGLGRGTQGAHWLTRIISEAPLVIVTVATVPGLRALDTALTASGRRRDAWCVVVGPPVRRWPKQLRLAATPAIDAVAAAGRLITVPEVRPLTMTGLTPDPLPAVLVAACTPLLDLADHLQGGNDDDAAI